MVKKLGPRPARWWVLLIVAGLLGASAALAPPASAHAELRQASPRVNSVVGGEFHSVSLQFSGLSEAGEFRAELLDPTGEPVGKPAVRERQRIVIPIDPLTTPGVYTVSYTSIGADGDLVSDLFTFEFQPGSPKPEPITLKITTAQRVGWFGYALLLVGAGLLGYIAHRFRVAIRAGRASAPAP